MGRIPTQQVTHDELESLFRQHNIWELIDKGLLTTVIVVEKDLPARSVAGGLSRIRKHFDLEGNHIATTQVVVDANGVEVHSDGKDIVIQGRKFTRP